MLKKTFIRMEENKLKEVDRQLVDNKAEVKAEREIKWKRNQ